MNDRVNGQILDFVERTYSSVEALASSDPVNQVWTDSSYKMTRSIQRVDDQQILVTFCISRHILFGFTSKVLERGLVFSEKGHVRDATNSELDSNSRY